jgi:type I restriction enzyme S subunit
MSEFPDHWQLLPLENVMEAIIDYRGKTPKKTDHGIPLITAKIVKGGRILEPAEFIAEEDYDSWMVRGLPKIGDVVVTSEAPLGEVAQLTSSNVALAQRIVTLRGKEGVLNNDFLLCAMQSSYVQHQLEARASGSTVKGIKQSELRKVLLPIPPENEQIEIAHHIKTLSNKIQLNRQTNQTLEHMAQAIFKSWFVDFEPTRAKIAAKEEWAKRSMTTKAGGSDNNIKESQAEATFVERAAMAAISGRAINSTNDSATGALAGLDQLNPEQIEQLKTTAALFPDTLVDSELGEIPEGWGIKEIKELSLKISKGTTPSKGDMQKAEDPETISFLKVRDISGSGEIRSAGLDKVPESVHTGAIKRSILQTNDLLFSIAGTIGRVALIEEELSNSNCNQAVAFIRLKEPNKHLELCRLNLVGSRVQNEVMSKVVQGVQANFSLTGLGEIQILIPSDDLLASFNEKLESAFKKQRLLLSENRKLEEIRDALLPKLLSGVVDLSGVDE